MLLDLISPPHPDPTLPLGSRKDRDFIGAKLRMRGKPGVADCSCNIKHILFFTPVHLMLAKCWNRETHCSKYMDVDSRCSLALTFPARDMFAYSGPAHLRYDGSSGYSPTRRRLI